VTADVSSISLPLKVEVMFCPRRFINRATYNAESKRA